ncbi:helix-turn-helix domain-containing protein [Paenibacillus haidiansis]
MTKKDFCQELGISTGNLGDWKRGKSTPSTNKLIEISAFFDTSLDWLLTGRERTPYQIHESMEAYVADVTKLGEMGGKLTPVEAAFIQEYLEFVQYRREKKKGGN